MVAVVSPIIADGVDGVDSGGIGSGSPEEPARLWLSEMTSLPFQIRRGQKKKRSLSTDSQEKTWVTAALAPENGTGSPCTALHCTVPPACQECQDARTYSITSGSGSRSGYIVVSTDTQHQECAKVRTVASETTRSWRSSSLPNHIFSFFLSIIRRLLFFPSQQLCRYPAALSLLSLCVYLYVRPPIRLSVCPSVCPSPALSPARRLSQPFSSPSTISHTPTPAHINTRTHTLHVLSIPYHTIHPASQPASHTRTQDPSTPICLSHIVSQLNILAP